MPHNQTSEPPGVVTIEYTLRTMMTAVEREIRFSSAIAPENTRSFQGAIELFSSSHERRKDAIRKTMELLEEFPTIALALLRRLAPEPHPVVPEEHHDKLLFVVKTWLLWAIRHAYITEHSHHFLAWIRVVRKVEETCASLLNEWRGDRTTEPGQLVQLGQQYPSIVLSYMLTEWALNAGERQPDQWHNLMVAITGIPDPVKNMHWAPIHGSNDDPGLPLTRWVEWYRRWRPVVAPLALWPPKEEAEKK